MSRRRLAGIIAAAVVAAWLAVPLLLAAAGCGSPSRATVAEPPSPPVVEPPSPPPVEPPPVEIVEGVTVRVIVDPSALPVEGVRVTLAPGIEARTDRQGAATFARLEVGAYTVTLADLPPLARQGAPVAISVTRDASEWLVSVVPNVPAGRVALLGDSDSSEPVPWRTSSVDDHLDELAPLLGWARYEHANLAQECTSASATPCPHRGIEQARRIERGTSVAVLRFGLNDLHYEESPGEFARAIREIVAEVQRRGALPILVAPQQEERPEFEGRRGAYLEALVGIAEATGALYVDPRIEWPGDRDLYDVDGIHLNDAGTRLVADAVLEAVIAGLTVGEEPAVEPPPPPPSAEPCDGGFVFHISWYGVASWLDALMRSDTDWLADELDACGYRVWVNWDRPDAGASAYRADGSVREDLWSGLVAAVDYAATKGLRIDVTFNGEIFDSLEAHQRAVRTTLERLRGHPAVWIVDLCNECEFESERYWRALVETARAADPLRRLTISFSGEPADVVARYVRMRDVLDLAAPHWPRVDGWEDDLVPLSLSLQRQSGLPVFAQEEAREGYEGDSWGVNAYVDACRSACDAGLVGYTQHTAAGFVAGKGSLRSQLDPITLEALTIQGADRCGCAP